MKHISTEKINKILSKYRSGEVLKRSETIFHQGIEGTINSKYPFLYTSDEILEWSKCYNDPIYFIENYCKIVLRDFQKNWIETYLNNRFNIFINSRQVGFIKIKSCLNLWEMIFHKKSVLLICNKLCSGVESIDIIKDTYLNLPYFLKSPIINWNRKDIRFINGSIKVISNLVIGANYNIIDIMEAFNISQDKQSQILKSLIPVQSALVGGRFCIYGQPMLGPFYDLCNNSSFSVTRTYWWQVPGRDESWVKKEIENLGSEELFDREYNLCFKSK
jgi:hypothetical protein